MNKYLPILAFLKDKTQREHLSSIMMELKPTLLLCTNENLPNYNSEIALPDFLTYINFIMELGNIEHSNDWDPFLQIMLFDNQIVETAQGFETYEIDHKANKITVTIPDPTDQNDTRSCIIPIDLIKAISLTR